MHARLRDEIDAFVDRKRRHRRGVVLRAVVNLALGTDPGDLGALDAASRAALSIRLRRRIRAERLRALREPWRYDLGRHIALKEALDTLTGTTGRRPAGQHTERAPTRTFRRNAAGAEKSARPPLTWKGNTTVSALCNLDIVPQD